MYGNYIDEPSMTYSGGIYFYVQDHLYSTAALVDASGTPQERYEYDAYGQVHILDANFADDADGVSDYNNPYMFTGRRVDFLDGGKLTLQINRHRYYDYYTGRWLTEDPLGVAIGPEFRVLFPKGQYLDGLNLYEYVASCPISLNDPEGLLFCDNKCWPPGDADIRADVLPIPVGHTEESVKDILQALKSVGRIRGQGTTWKCAGGFVATYAALIAGFYLDIDWSVKCCVPDRCCHPLSGWMWRFNWGKRHKYEGRHPPEGEEVTLVSLMDSSGLSNALDAYFWYLDNVVAKKLRGAAKLVCKKAWSDKMKAEEECH
jgi:RHS repeat-associated protein